MSTLVSPVTLNISEMSRRGGSGGQSCQIQYFLTNLISKSLNVVNGVETLEELTFKALSVFSWRVLVTVSSYTSTRVSAVCASDWVFTCRHESKHEIVGPLIYNLVHLLNLEQIA